MPASSNLSVALERAVIEHNLDEDECIYVTEDGWVTYVIRILYETGVIRFSTFANFRKSATTLQRLKLSNKFNATNNLLTSFVDDDGSLYFDYALIFRDGLLRETFIRTCRQFSSNIEHGLKDVDPDNSLVFPPGDMETEE